MQHHASFFTGPGGVITLAVVSSLAGAVALFFLRTIPLMFGLLDDIKGILQPTDKTKPGLVDRLSMIEGKAAALQMQVDNSIQIRARDIETLRTDVRDLRQLVERKAL